MLKIWGRNNSVNVQKVMWTVAELGLEHERIDAGGAFGKLDTPEYAAMNPNRHIPVVQDGALVVWESNVCVRYLAAKYGNGSLWSEDPGERALADMWMDWMGNTLVADLTTVFWGLIRTPPEQRDMNAIKAAVGRLGANWKILDGHLAGRDYVAGERLTMGDIPVGAACYRYYQLAIDRPSLPHVDAWYQRLQARSAFAQHVMIPLT